jgi:hypothetical protein
LGEARPKAATIGAAMFADQQHRTAPFASDREALDESADDQQGRRKNADLLVSREQTDGNRAQPDDQQTPLQQLLAADRVAEVPEDDAADRACDESDCIRAECGDDAE